MRVDPEDPTPAVHRGHADEGPERDRMVAAQDNRCRTAATRPLDELRHAIAERENLRQETRTLVVARDDGLRDGRLDVAEVIRLDAERPGEMLGELGVPDR